MRYTIHVVYNLVCAISNLFIWGMAEVNNFEKNTKKNTNFQKNNKI